MKIYVQENYRKKKIKVHHRENEREEGREDVESKGRPSETGERSFRKK